MEKNNKWRQTKKKRKILKENCCPIRSQLAIQKKKSWAGWACTKTGRERSCDGISWVFRGISRSCAGSFRICNLFDLFAFLFFALVHNIGKFASIILNRLLSRTKLTDLVFGCDSFRSVAKFVWESSGSQEMHWSLTNMSIKSEVL